MNVRELYQMMQEIGHCEERKRRGNHMRLFRFARNDFCHFCAHRLLKITAFRTCAPAFAETLRACAAGAASARRRAGRKKHAPVRRRNPQFEV